MKNHLRFLLGLLLCALLAACDQQALIDRFTPKEQAAHAKQLVEQFARRDFAGIESQFHPDARTATTREQLEQVAALVPTEAALSMKTVGAFTGIDNGRKSYRLTFEYQYPASWLLVTVVLREEEGKDLLYAFNVQPMQQSLEEFHRFSFDGKGALHYLVFALSIAIPLFILVTVVACVRSRLAERKWLWILLMLFGVCRFDLNWTTGDWSFRPLSINLLGAAFTAAGPGAPWILTLAFPLAAVVFWVRMSGLRARAREQAAGKAAADQAVF